MILHDAAWAPSPRRVRIFLAEKGMSVERRVVDLRAGEQLGEAYLAVNPRGAVPALEFDDGSILTESAAICRYFEAVQPDPPLFGTTPEEIGWIESWTRRIEGEGYAAAAYVFRNKSPAFRDRAIVGIWPVVPQIPELATRGMLMWAGFIDALDARLADRDWIASDGYSFADLTALVAIDFAKAAKLTVPESAGNVRRWHATVSARPSAGA